MFDSQIKIGMPTEPKKHNAGNNISWCASLILGQAYAMRNASYRNLLQSIAMWYRIVSYRIDSVNVPPRLSLCVFCFECFVLATNDINSTNTVA
jgi:hypothetical protein